MRLRSLLAALVALGLLAAACGGDDADTGADESPTAPAATAEPASPGEDGDDEPAAGGEDWPDQLVLGLVPSREADVLVESAQPLADALGDALGIEVEAFVPQDYTGLTEAMASGQADIGAFGPLGIVRAQERANVDFILQSERFGSYTYHTQYMTNDPDTYCADEPVADDEGYLYCNGTLEAEEGPVGGDQIATIDAGTSLSYVDPTSTSGYLIPALQMLESGVPLEELETIFAGGHDASVIAVYNGDVEVGLSFDDARTAIVEEFPDVGEQVVVWAYSEEIPNDGFVIRSELPDDLRQAVVEAMLDYASTEEGQEVLNSIYEIDGLREAEQGVLDVVRRADEELGDTLEEG